MIPGAETSGYAELVAGDGMPCEEDLLAAYELGRTIAAEGGGVLDAVAVHEQAMTTLCSACGGHIGSAANARAQQLLAELLGAFEMALRGYQESNEQLSKARADAEQANNAKNEFLSRTSHELRTPLNAILGFGQLLQMDELTDDQAASVHDILSAGRHLLRLIDEVLEISRIEAGSLSLSIEPVMVGDIADSAISVMRPLAAQRGIALNVDLGDLRPRFVQSDRQRLHQVLLNLLSNAIKYNRANGSVTLACSESAGRMRFEVADTGPGLDEGQLTRLFSPFDRLGAEATQIEGTGLGLALSKSLCEAMGGTLSVRSTVGTGSWFAVELSVAEVDDIGDVAGCETSAPAAAPSDAPSVTVLYIEDNPSNLKLVERVLERWRSVTLLSAMQGALGVELAQRHHPDLVLLDLHLPDRHGWEVLAELRADEQTAGIPVVVVSADATQGEIRRLLELGAAEYVTKPLDIGAFLQTLDRVLLGAPA
jgi:signal transduction histidine kinase/ActR/RegA family two-component response regulator